MTQSNLALINEEDASGEQYTKMVKVTPAMAEKWLKRNTNNRSISDGLVISYAEDMKAGAWHLHHQGIAFDQAGDLIDGQHRLHAIVLAGVPVQMLVTHNVARESFADIDGGRPRPVGTRLTLFHDITNGKRVAAVGAMIQKIESGYKDSNQKVTVAEVLEVYGRHKAGVDWALEALGAGRLWGSAPLTAAMAFAFPRDPEKAAVFAAQVRDGENIHKADPAFALRKFILDMRGLSSVVDRKMVASVTLRAFYAFCHGHSLEVIKPALLQLDSTIYKTAVAYFKRAHK